MNILEGKLLFVVSEDYYFLNHWIQLALSAKKQGLDVVVVTRYANDYSKIQQAGFRVVPIVMNRRGLNPFSLIFEVISLAKIFYFEKPTLIHLVALRPVVIGGLAALLTNMQKVFFSLTGMGYLFTGSGPVWARYVVERCLSILLSRGLTIVQNPDDFGQLVCLGVPPDQIRMIPGATGVDTIRFAPQIVRSDSPIVMMASRLLWDKGVGEFIKAAQISKNFDARFVLVGALDSSNPASISSEMMGEWVAKGLVEWWGHCEDMPSVLAQAAVVCLPSYREGLPVILLEAMACAKPCISTDVPGCREAVQHEISGLLVPPKDANALSSAIDRLLGDADLRLKMGQYGRDRVMKEFSQKQVIGSTLSLYEEMLG